MSKKNGQRRQNRGKQNKGKQNSVPKALRPLPIPRGNLQERAEREVGLAYDPVLEAIARQQNQARDDHLETQEAYRNIGRGLENELDSIGNNWTPYNRISNELVGNVQALPTFQGPAPEDFGAGPTNAGENAAAAQVMQGIGSGAQAALAGIGQRDIAYGNSVDRQAAVDLANRRANELERYNDLIDQLNGRQLDVTEDMPAEYLQRRDQLSDQRFTQQLQRAQFGLERQAQRSSNKASEWLMDYLQNKLDSRGRGGGGGGGRFPGHGNPGTVQTGSDKGRLDSELRNREAQEDLYNGRNDGGGKPDRNRGGSPRLQHLNSEIAEIKERYPGAQQDQYGEWYIMQFDVDGRLKPTYLPRLAELIEKRQNVKSRRKSRTSNKGARRRNIQDERGRYG